MAKSDFTKTSAQVENEITDLIDSVDRSLDSSSNDSEKKGQLIVSGFVSLLVFAAILGFDLIVGTKEVPVVANEPEKNSISEREVKFVDSHLTRIEEQVTSIMSMRDLVAPSMVIDGQAASIRNSTTDIRRIMAVDSLGGDKKNGDGASK